MECFSTAPSLPQQQRTTFHPGETAGDIWLSVTWQHILKWRKETRCLLAEDTCWRFGCREAGQLVQEPCSILVTHGCCCRASVLILTSHPNPNTINLPKKLTLTLITCYSHLSPAKCVHSEMALPAEGTALHWLQHQLRAHFCLPTGHPKLWVISGDLKNSEIWGLLQPAACWLGHGIDGIWSAFISKTCQAVLGLLPSLLP